MNRLLFPCLERTWYYRQLMVTSISCGSRSWTNQPMRSLTIWNSTLHGTAAAQQKKSKESAKISLKGPDESLSVTTLEEAQKLAKRRNLNLVREQESDSKTRRPLYRLVTSAELLAEKSEELSNEKSQQTKSVKTLKIGSRISDNDLAARLKNISKWLKKNHEVHILIHGSSGDMSSCEKIVKTIESFIKEPEVVGKIVQKRSGGVIIRFNILPVKPVSSAVKTDLV